jgi:hypothetical protein
MNPQFAHARITLAIALLAVLAGDVSLASAENSTLCDNAQADIAAATIENVPMREGSATGRVSRRIFPSIFQAWRGILIDGAEVSSPEAIARHDLVWHNPEFFGARWATSPAFLANTLTQNSRRELLNRLAALREKNSKILVLAALPYWDAPTSSFPIDSPLWLRDTNGNRRSGWVEGGYNRLDLGNQQLRTDLVARAQALIANGLFDGIFLDWWNENDQPNSRRQFLTDLKRNLRPDALILANVNYSKTRYSAQYLNGVFLESGLPCAPGCGAKNEAQEWRRLAEAILFYGRSLQPPRVIATEVWRCNANQKDKAACDREDLAHPNRMLAATAMALTLSNGYVLFSDPNALPTPDHLHRWYPEWEHKIGRPKGPSACLPNGVVRRVFDSATVYFNATDEAQTVKTNSGNRTLPPWHGLIARSAQP